MKKNLFTSFMAGITIISLMFTGCSKTSVEAKTTETVNIDTEFTQRDLDSSYNRNSSNIITIGPNTTAEGAEVKDGVVTIKNEGCYVVNGKASGVQLNINAPQKKVQLVLEGVTIENKVLVPVKITEADKVVITLAQSSNNILSVSGDTKDEDGVVFSKADLTINGQGSLDITTGYKHGIVSKDDLVITGGNIKINAEDDGIEGKDCVKIGGGNIAVTAGSDGIKSDNTEENKGYVYIKDGSINITAANDGIQSEGILLADGGNINIKTGEGHTSKNAKANTVTQDDMKFRPQDGNPPQPPQGFDGKFQPDGRPEMPPDGFGRHMDPQQGQMPQQNKEPVSEITTAQYASENPSETTSEQQSDSKKAIKSEKKIIINNGTFTLDSEDDSVHTNGDLAVNGGTFTINSGSDALQADGNVDINSGEISVASSYEGIEGGIININNGTISIVSSDDGINASSDVLTADTMAININGGNLKVDAKGDGLDSNGSLYLNGGEVYVSGSEDMANSAIDYEKEAIATGGTLIATGSAGMAQTFSEKSTQYSILHNFDTTAQGNEQVTLASENGSVIAQYTPSKKYQSVLVTSPKLKNGKTYKVSAGSQSADITLSSVITSNAAQGFGGFGGHGRMDRQGNPVNPGTAKETTTAAGNTAAAA